jgi:hypothetical protein
MKLNHYRKHASVARLKNFNPNHLNNVTKSNKETDSEINSFKNMTIGHGPEKPKSRKMFKRKDNDDSDDEDNNTPQKPNNIMSDTLTNNNG